MCLKWSLCLSPPNLILLHLPFPSKWQLPFSSWFHQKPHLFSFAQISYLFIHQQSISCAFKICSQWDHFLATSLLLTDSELPPFPVHITLCLSLPLILSFYSLFSTKQPEASFQSGRLVALLFCPRRAGNVYAQCSLCASPGLCAWSLLRVTSNSACQYWSFCSAPDLIAFIWENVFFVLYEGVLLLKLETLFLFQTLRSIRYLLLSSYK